MSKREISISTIDELKLLLEKTYWIETKLENSSQWTAYIRVEDQKVRDVIYKISHDSEKHKTILKGIYSNIEGVDPEKAMKDAELDMEFDFKNKMDDVIIKELLKNETIALDMYSKLFTYADRKFIREIWNGDNYEMFFQQLETS